MPARKKVILDFRSGVIVATLQPTMPEQRPLPKHLNTTLGEVLKDTLQARPAHDMLGAGVLTLRRASGSATETQAVYATPAMYQEPLLHSLLQVASRSAGLICSMVSSRSTHRGCRSAQGNVVDGAALPRLSRLAVSTLANALLSGRLARGSRAAAVAGLEQDREKYGAHTRMDQFCVIQPAGPLSKSLVGVPDAHGG